VIVPTMKAAKAPPRVRARARSAASAMTAARSEPTGKFVVIRR
jgi:hypothetical protein